MRSWTAQFLSFIIGALGFVSILWLSTAFLGQAQSQDAASNEAGVQAPSPAVEAPSMNLPPMTDDANSSQMSATMTEASVPEIIAGDGFVYDPQGRRDPFRPFGSTGPQSTTPQPLPLNKIPGGPSAVPSPPLVSNQGEEPRPPETLDALQTFDISQLKIVGIIWEVKNPKAMVQDPVGKLYVIKKDSKLGRNRGFVAAIREGEVVIVEPAVVEGLNTATTRVLTLTR